MTDSLSFQERQKSQEPQGFLKNWEFPCPWDGFHVYVSTTISTVIRSRRLDCSKTSSRQVSWVARRILFFSSPLEQAQGFFNSVALDFLSLYETSFDLYAILIVYWKQRLASCNEVQSSWIVPVFIHKDRSSVLTMLSTDCRDSSGVWKIRLLALIHKRIIRRDTILCPSSSQTDDPSQYKYKTVSIGNSTRRSQFCWEKRHYYDGSVEVSAPTKQEILRKKKCYGRRRRAPRGIA